MSEVTLYARDWCLKLRKVELFGFKSFCEKTPITFSGTGITCIVGPNGCGKSNVVDAISWVLGEQSKKMLRAESMSDCIFNGTAKRPPMGLSEVTLTLVDPELIEAARKVAAAPVMMAEASADEGAGSGPVAVAESPSEMVIELDEHAGPVIVDPITHVTGEVTTSVEDGFVVVTSSQEYSTDVADVMGETAAGEFASAEMALDAPVEIVAEADANDAASDSAIVTQSSPAHKFKKKRGAEKAASTMKVGEVVVGRRLYRSGQSEYMINGRVSRLRDVQELFSGLGLGPDSYAIIEQGRIGQILNSKPMDRRAIIEEAAGITMYKTKRRLAEAKLEASKVNLSRIHDILVEVEKQLASLKRQASKARRYAELREQMRGSLRIVLASKAQHLDIEAARLENLLREMETVESRDAMAVHQLEGEQERLSNRSYELDEEFAADAEPAEPGCARAGPRGEPDHVQPGAGGANFVARDARRYRTGAGPAHRRGPEHAHGGASRSGGGVARADLAARDEFTRRRGTSRGGGGGTVAARRTHQRAAHALSTIGRGFGAPACGIAAGGRSSGAAHGGRRAALGGDARGGRGMRFAG